MIGRRTLIAGGGTVAAARAAAQVSNPKTVYPIGIKRRDVRFAGAGGATLAGTLVLPLSSEMQYVPGVVLIAGSGPTDRDGNNPGVPARVDLLKQIAEILAAAGTASLRYDKRGIGASTPAPSGRENREAFFAWENFVGDVQAAHAELLRHDEIKFYATALLGHSEGGLLALAAMAASKEKVETPAVMKKRPYALVLAATPGLPLGEIVHRQMGRNAPALTAAADRIMAAIRDSGHAPADSPPELRGLFPPYIGPFLQGAMAFDPAKTLAGLDAPCLLLQGGADAQVVPMGDVQPLIDALARREAHGEVLVAPEVSHNLKLISRPDDPGYAGSVAPVIADKLVSWLRSILDA